MIYQKIIHQLSENEKVFKEHLFDKSDEVILWKQQPNKWCLLEIVCHLYDEEREDFRARLKNVLETPNQSFIPIAPAEWFKDRKYIEKNYNEVVQNFLKERRQSIKWLQSLNNPKWDNAYKHPKFGDMTAKMFLSNWLAHDFLHLRQIVKLKYDYLKYFSDESLTYAGGW